MDIKGKNWIEMLRILGGFKSKLYHCLVYWRSLEEGTLRCNTDGASKGNPRESAYGIFFRNWEGNLVYAQTEQIGITTNIEAETRAIRMTLKVFRKGMAEGGH